MPASKARTTCASINCQIDQIARPRDHTEMPIQSRLSRNRGGEPARNSSNDIPEGHGPTARQCTGSGSREVPRIGIIGSQAVDAFGSVARRLQVQFATVRVSSEDYERINGGVRALSQAKPEDTT